MTPEEIKDMVLLQRQIAWQYQLDNLSTKELKRVQRSINVAKEEIVAYFRQRGDDIGEWTGERLDDVMSELDSMTFAMQGEMGQNLQDLYSNVGTQALAAQNNMLSFGNRVAGFNFVALSAAQLKSIASETAVGGQQLNYWVKKVFDKTMQKELREQVMAGMLKGEGYPQFVKRLQAQFGNLSRREATTLARTYVQSANVNAQSSVYKANRDIVKQVKWSAVLEPGYSKTGRGTCIRCSALDGNTYDHDDHPFIPLHPRCRCILLPVTATYRELGLDIDEIQQNYRPYTIRGNKNVGAGGKRRIINTGFHKGNYDTWFDKQPRKFKQNMLGPGRMKLYDEGVSYKQMVSPTTGRLYTLDEIDIFKVEGWPIGATDYAKMPKAEKDALKKLLLDKGPYTTLESLEHLNGREVKMLASGVDVPTFGRNRVAISDDIVAYYKKAGVKPPPIKPPPGPIITPPSPSAITIQELDAMTWPQLRKFGSGLGIKGKHGRPEWNKLILEKMGGTQKLPKIPKVTPPVVKPDVVIPNYKSMSWPEVRAYARELGIKGKHKRPDLEKLIADAVGVDGDLAEVQNIVERAIAGAAKELSPEDAYLNQLRTFNTFFEDNPKYKAYKNFRKASMGWATSSTHNTFEDYAVALAQHQRMLKAEADYMKWLKTTDYDKWKDIRKQKLDKLTKKNILNRGSQKIDKGAWAEINEQLFQGTEHLDDGLFLELERSNLEFKFKKVHSASDNRAFFRGRDFSVNFYHGNIAATRDQVTTIAHEVGHSVDHWLNGKGSHRGRGSGRLWADNMLVRTKDGKNYREWFKKPQTGSKGKYSNKDGYYWKGNWIHDYEGRIYEKYGATTVGEEFFSMGSQRYRNYYSRVYGTQSKLWDEMMTEADRWRELSNIQQKDMDYYRWTNKAKYENAKLLQTEYRQNSINWGGIDDGSPRPKTTAKMKEMWAEHGSDWGKQKRHYPEFAEFMDDFYKKEWDYALDPKWKDIEAAEAAWLKKQGEKGLESAGAHVTNEFQKKATTVINLSDDPTMIAPFKNTEWRAKALFDSVDEIEGYKYKSYSNVLTDSAGEQYREVSISTHIRNGKPDVALIKGDQAGITVRVYKNGDMQVTEFSFPGHGDGQVLVETLLNSQPWDAPLYIPKKIADYGDGKFWDSMYDKFMEEGLWTRETPWDWRTGERRIHNKVVKVSKFKPKGIFEIPDRSKEVFTNPAKLHGEMRKLNRELSQEAREVVERYVDGKTGREWNERIRKGLALTSADAKDVKAVDNVLNKLPKFKGKSYRTISFDTPEQADDFFARFRKGEAFEDPAFMSSSSSPQQAAKFVSGPSEYNVLFEIEGKNGRSISAFSDFPEHRGQQEILFRQNSRFEITKVETQGDGFKRVWVKEIDDPPKKVAPDVMKDAPEKPKVAPKQPGSSALEANTSFNRRGTDWFFEGRKIDPLEAERLNAMKLPPSWKNVIASTDTTTKVQAMGQDAAGRWQYRYSAAHIKKAAMKKFVRVRKFNDDIEKLRATIAAADKDDVMANLLKLEDRTAIRMGNPKDIGARKKAYGITTLQHEHVKVDGDRLIFDFVAKEGKDAHYEVVDADLARFIKGRLAKTKAGERLWPEVSPQRMNAYIKELAGKDYSIKDFRTYHGTRIAYEKLQKYAGKTLNKNQKKNVVSG